MKKHSDQRVIVRCKTYNEIAPVTAGRSHLLTMIWRRGQANQESNR